MNTMPTIGEIINSRWRLVDELSTDSGQGNTFLAVDLLNDNDKTHYVVKLPRVADFQALSRFNAEITASLSLNHPNIVKVKDSLFEGTSNPYLVTEYCSGGELNADRIKNLSLLEKLRMFETICEAIAYAHNSNPPVIHRDIKPRNIFFEDLSSLTPIVGDFGLCFFNDSQRPTRNTATREAVGAWEFRPPEAAIGRVESCTPQWDVYMLGKLLYWLVSGGELLEREYYREEPLDLRPRFGDPVIQFIYELFDKTIVEKTDGRYESAQHVLDHVKKVIEYAEQNARYLDVNLPQRCVFCRTGLYNWEYLGTRNDDRYRLEWFGLRFVKNNVVVVYPRILIGTCKHCGNIQQFRLDEENKLSGEWKNLPRSPFS
jgi:serine/threonine protein kinase